jgi:uncharacterized peroxidase-related enzyme
MSKPDVADDVMSRLAGIVAGSPAAEARALRPDVIRFTQTSDEAMLSPRSTAGFTHAERAAIGLRVARRLEDRALIAHYETMLRSLDPSGALLATTQGATPASDDRWSRMLAHADRLTAGPGASEPAHLKLLGDAGLSPQAIVALSQLIAYVNYQSRSRAGLAVIGAGSPGSPAASDALPPVKPMRDFTKGELEWEPWLAPVEFDHATAEQRAALKITPSNRAVGAYALVLAHDPESVKERSPLYNAIMFGPKGLARADRELGATVASRINGCAYCASVHAKRFIELAKEPEVMERLHKDGLGAMPDPRRAAIVAYAAKLTSRPSTLGPTDAAPLRAVGLSDGDILDLTNAVAMFAWANRLMQSLGGAV